MNRDFRRRKTAARSGKMAKKIKSIALEERNVLVLDLNESRESFFQRGRVEGSEC